MSLSFTVVDHPRRPRRRRAARGADRARAATLGPGADVVDAALGGGLAAFLAEAGFEGKLGRDARGADRGQLQAKAALLVGVGDPAELTVDGVRRAAAAVARRAGKVASVATTLRDGGRPSSTVADAAQAVAEGFVLGALPVPRVQGRRDALEAEEGRRRRCAAARAVKAAVERGAAVGDAVAWARDLVNTPSKEKTPAERGRRSAQAAPRHAASPCRCSTCAQLAGATHRRRARRRPGVGAAAALPQDDVRAVGRARQAARVRRQGRGVRLRRPVAQDRRRHGDDEDRHGGRCGGDRARCRRSPRSA